MKKRIRHTLFVLFGAPMLFQFGCISAADIQDIAEGHFITLVKSLINSVTSDVLSGAIGG